MLISSFFSYCVFCLAALILLMVKKNKMPKAMQAQITKAKTIPYPALAELTLSNQPSVTFYCRLMMFLMVLLVGILIGILSVTRAISER